MNWHFYDPATGIMLRKRLACPRSQLAANTPAGFLPIPGQFDPLSQRVDVAAVPPEPIPGEPTVEWWPPVVDYQPPAPADDDLQTWVWNPETKRWVATPTLAAIKKAKVQELAQAFDAEYRGGMAVGQVRVPTDTQAITDYLLLRQMAADGAWIDTPLQLEGGAFVLVTQTMAAALWAAPKTHRRTLVAKLRDKVELVQGASTAAGVAAITWAAS
jgi:hypothetical protein